MEGYPCFPMFVDISEKHIVVIGAGAVAARRVRTLSAFARRITVVAPEIHPDIEMLESEEKIIVVRRRYAEADLQSAQIVLAATDDTVLNEEISLACRQRGIPVNVSSDRRLCDFYFPGIVRRDDVVIGVTTSGRDRQKAKAVTSLLSKYLDNFLELMRG